MKELALHAYVCCCFCFRNGYIDVINWLVRSGKVDPRMKDGHGRTLIFTAVVHNQPKVIQFLLNQVSGLTNIALASQTFGHDLDTQTIKNHQSGQPNIFVNNFLKCKFQAYDIFIIKVFQP